jgi:16S rRNA (uracil1498-N3)-methyltransferase
MLRRVHLPLLTTGSIALPPAAAHHIRDVLRLGEGDAVELFDDSGNTSTASLKHVNPANVVVWVESIKPPAETPTVVIASAIPKGDRADWMIEKLTEIGVTRFIPVAAERSVTLPGGRNKVERWERIAVEAARQSRRIGTMSIAPLTSLAELIKSAGPDAWYMSTAPDAVPVLDLLKDPAKQRIALIGPEGGWTPAEIEQMGSAGFHGIALTASVLRVETAAVMAAGLMCLKPGRRP